MMTNVDMAHPHFRPIRSTRVLMVAHSDHYLREHLVLGLEQSGFSVHNASYVRDEHDYGQQLAKPRL